MIRSRIKLDRSGKLAEHEDFYEGELRSDYLDVYRNRDETYSLILPGFGRLETVLRFDRVSYDSTRHQSTFQFSLNGYVIAQIENDANVWGAPGRWLKHFAEQGEPPEVVVR